MTEWIDYAKVVGAFVGAGGVATLAKLYHDKVVTGKNTELKIKDAELDRIRADLRKAEALLSDEARSPRGGAGNDLAQRRATVTTIIERLARTLHAQAASLYIPLYSAREGSSDFPRGFAFVAACNVDPAATDAILRLKLVESWTIVGECWSKGAMIEDNQLQANLRHVASYDKQSGFVPVHTLLAPIAWQTRQIGVVQLFNKSANGGAGAIDEHGFASDDRKALALALQDTSAGGLAAQTHGFESDPDWTRFLGLQDEIDLENAVIMYVDLTRSSALFSELPLIDAAALINRFNEHLYRKMGPYAAVVEKFNGDGALLRFHYGGFESGLPASNPGFRAVCAAADLIGDFDEFKAKRWKRLAVEPAQRIRLRITIALGPVISINVGPRQFQAPTVFGQCVNRSAKMVAHAPRDRDLVLIDDNVRKALLQIDRGHDQALRPFDRWREADAGQTASLSGHTYYDVDVNHFALAAARMSRMPP